MNPSKRRLIVGKANGSREEYLHTKVMGTISKAFSSSEEGDVFMAEHLAEAVTYYLYRSNQRSLVSSGEVFSVIKTCLAETGYEQAAIALDEHHCRRKLNRSRVEVVCVELSEPADAELLYGKAASVNSSRWDKSRIVADLTNGTNLSMQTARMIASMVEEKVFGMHISHIPASLIKQLVLTDSGAVLQAEKQLAGV